MVLPQDSSTQRKYLGKPRHILSAFRWASLVAHLVKNPPAMQGSNMGLIPGMGRALGERKGYPLQYSGLENSMNRSLAGYSLRSRKESASTPGLPVHHQLPELTQTHGHRVSDAIQPTHPLSSPSPAVLNLSQHQGLFK